MKFTQIPANTFKNLQMNAGILLDSFDPATGEIGNIVGATSGGVQLADASTYTDMGDDIDNAPKNMKELKKLESHAVTMSGTFVSVTAATAKLLVGTGDIDASDATHIIPRNDVIAADFMDLWWVGDYSDQNTGANAGFMAIHLKNALNTGGFQIQTGDRAKGTFAFSFEGHYSMDAQDEVPYEIYVKEGTPAGSITLSDDTLELAVGDDPETLTATVSPVGTEVTWASSNTAVATVTSGGAVSPVSAGTSTITARINVDGAVFSATCAVTVTSE
jgi:hypothetical protein